MNINEEMKNSYDVIAQKKNGKVTVIYEAGSGMKSSYASVLEYTEDYNRLGLRGIVMECING